MKYKWNVPESIEPVPKAVLEATGNRLFLARILQRRGHSDPEAIRSFLFSEWYTPAPPSELPNLLKGVERIERAIDQQERILVWGDFDVDGQTSTSLLYAALSQLGALVDYHIPIREKESHGIRPEFLQPYLEDGVQILLSCDTGIAAHEAIELANRYGTDVIVTDHHDCPPVLPPAYALINPKLYDAPHPLSSLPGVGVAYKFIESLFERAGRADETAAYLDLVALGIVADLAILTEDTRYLLQQGLDALRRTERVGLLELMENAQVIPEHIIDEHIGFQIGPRLNAVGRLADANISVPLLTTRDQIQAQEIAEQLERLNEERRFQTELVYGSAMEQVKNDPALLRYAVLVLGHPTWHQGVIGIVASRLVEAFGRPAILLATPDGELARGSARSVEGVHITQAIATQEELLEGYGGHPMAAGLAIDPVYIDRFRRGVSTAAVEQMTGHDAESFLDIDAVVSLDQLNEDLVNQIELLAPFGPGNPPINIMCRKVHVVNHEFIGKDKSHKKLTVQQQNGDVARKILWWNSANESLPEGAIDMVIRARLGFFRGEPQLTLTLQDHRVSGVRLEQEPSEKTISITDCRKEESPLRALDELLSKFSDILVWGEGTGLPESAVSRMDLKRASTLVVWTTPPSQEVLSSVVEKVGPEQVYVFAINPQLDDETAFVKRLIGLLKYAMAHYSGTIHMEKLTSAMSHTRGAIEEGLAILPSVGLDARVRVNGEIQLTHRPDKADGFANKKLRFILNETRTYRIMLEQSQELSHFVRGSTSQYLN